MFRVDATFFVTAPDEYQADSAFDAFLETADEVDEVRFASSTRTEITDGFRIGDRVRVREGTKPDHYAGRTGVVELTNETWVYVQGAQLMGTDPAGFKPGELEHA